LQVKGQQEIHQKIMQLNFRDCHAKIRQVDAHNTLGNGVVVQVSGELSNNGQAMRRFMQTFVLAPQSPKKYYVHNDIFRYQVTARKLSLACAGVTALVLV
jgi:Ras GTPase-activating protein-binding protein 1